MHSLSPDHVQLPGGGHAAGQGREGREGAASDGTPAVADGSEVARLLPRLWQLPWENQHKEVYWRLVLNGLALASRMCCVLRQPSAPVDPPACSGP